MKKIFIQFLLFFTFLYPATAMANEVNKKDKVDKSDIGLTAEEKEWIKTHTVKMGVEQWVPVVFSNDGKDIDGIAGDFSKQLIRKTGLKVTIVNDNWDTLLKDFKDKKIDVLPATYYTDKRAKFGLYSSGYFKMKDSIYIKESNTEINSLEDLNGKTLAIPKGYGTIDKLAKNFPQIKLVFTKDLDDSINRVLNGRVLAFYEGQVAAEAKINDELIKGLKGLSVDSFKAPTLHFFSKIDEPLLQSIIQKGLNSLSYQEKSEIISKWGSTKRDIELSLAEQKWLDKEQTLHYVFDPDWKPLEWSNDLGEHAGIVSDLIKLVKQKSGLNLRPVTSKTWSEAVERVKSKEISLYSGIGETTQRKRYLNFTQNQLFITPFVFVSKQGIDYLNGFGDLDNKKVGVSRNSTIEGLLKEKKPKLKLMAVKGTQDGFDRLVDGSIDVVIINAATAKFYINVLGYNDLKIAYKTEFNLELKMAIRKESSPEILSIIDKAIALISEKEVDDIFYKYTEITIQKHTDWLLIAQIGSVTFFIILFVLWNNKKLKSMVKEKTMEMSLLLKSFDKNVIASKTDTKGIITDVSEAFCQVSGYTQEELIGKYHNIVRHPDTPNAVFIDLWKTIQSGKIWKGEVKNRKKSGGFYWLDVIITPIVNNQGQISGYSAIRQDITAQKAVETLSKDLERKVDERTKDLAVTMKNLKRQMRIAKVAERKQNELLIEVEQTNMKIAAMHQHTRDSINYASLIQSALIPDNKLFRNYFSDYFVIWHPKDIVGGDIYLFEKLRDGCLIMAIDCTGHGVPGAFVTMLVKAVERQLLAEISSHPEMTISPAWILSYFNRHIKMLLKQENSDSISNAGFDGGIIYYNKKDKILTFAGAETSLFYIEDGEIKTIKGTRYSVGYKKCAMDYVYQEHSIKVKEGMQFYLTTDGYLDQNGGKKGFPFGKKRLKNIIQEYHGESMADQQQMFLYLMAEYEEEYKNTHGEVIDRNDDMTVIGLTI